MSFFETGLARDMACEATRPVTGSFVIEPFTTMRTSPPSKLNGLTGEVEGPPGSLTREDWLGRLNIDMFE